MNTTNSCINELRYRIFQSPVSQEQVARAVGMDPSPFSRVLRGRQNPPEGFIERVNAALDRLERAEAAAEEARQRVLAEGE